MRNRKALIIGIDEYPIFPLNGCVADAKKIGEIISCHDNYDKDENFTVQIESAVRTKAQLKRLIKELFSGKYETALFYFSGHAMYQRSKGYILAPDYQEDDEGVDMDEILSLANKSKSIDKVIILDCCNSGAFGSPPDTDGTMSNLGQGVTVLAASNEEQEAFQVNGKGIFTSLLINALQGGAADVCGYISPGGVYAYIDQALGMWARQRPVFKTNVQRFTILRKITPQVPIRVIKNIGKYFTAEDTKFPLSPAHEFTNISTSKQAIKPYADPEKVKVFKELQQLQSIGLVVPVGASYMYFAAMRSKSCKLTSLGRHYWRLINAGIM